MLGKVCSISESMGVNVIGIAPTHKARTELSKVGYEQNDTVKGMLFKLHNGRFSLPKNSLIVVDEAGMVASQIKSIRPPEPYKGKGIKEQGQYILRKEGKKK